MLTQYISSNYAFWLIHFLQLCGNELKKCLHSTFPLIMHFDWFGGAVMSDGTIFYLTSAAAFAACSVHGVLTRSCRGLRLRSRMVSGSIPSTICLHAISLYFISMLLISVVPFSVANTTKIIFLIQNTHLDRVLENIKIVILQTKILRHSYFKLIS